MRKREEIEKEFSRKCKHGNKDSELNAQKLLLEVMLDMRDLMVEIDLDDYTELIENCNCPDIPCDAKVGITEEEILTMFKESTKHERKRRKSK